ncbi:uncharacterized protein LOC128882850 isoform X2 [Hylaeus volcanicus]|uniref:uncharacterized protein LOC128882850 isoform X2 n=1 Tax=Hylaeus volcanicus TaxID=313075 RepID=UPI0023B7986A|nr:uncharacterized protein LOC128882850 isoform X2 [Hylaeus volcanicus]
MHLQTTNFVAKSLKSTYIQYFTGSVKKLYFVRGYCTHNRHATSVEARCSLSFVASRCNRLFRNNFNHWFSSSTRIPRKLEYTQLPNGLRVVSYDRGGHIANLGITVQAGSRFETNESLGCSHFLETMAFQSTFNKSSKHTATLLDKLVANASCSAGRESIFYNCEVERKDVGNIFHCVSENVTCPLFLSSEINQKINLLEKDKRNYTEDIALQLPDHFHSTSWPNNTLGNPQYGYNTMHQHFNIESLSKFHKKHYTLDPLNAFSHYTNATSTSALQKAQYKGGIFVLDKPSPLLHLLITYPTPGGLLSNEIIVLTVLQTLLGGGGSFSSGGPGKGMYSRLYQKVLCSHWVENCIAFNVQYSDDGGFGIYLIGNPSKAELIIRTIANQLRNLSFVSREELSRAKNLLKASILSNSENRMILLENIAQRVLMNKDVLSEYELCDLVNKVTVEDVERVGKHLICSKNPTIIALGDTFHVPPHDEIMNSLQNKI